MPLKDTDEVYRRGRMLEDVHALAKTALEQSRHAVEKYSRVGDVALEHYHQGRADAFEHVVSLLERWAEKPPAY